MYQEALRRATKELARVKRRCMLAIILAVVSMAWAIFASVCWINATSGRTEASPYDSEADQPIATFDQADDEVHRGLDDNVVLEKQPAHWDQGDASLLSDEVIYTKGAGDATLNTADWDDPTFID